MPRIRTSSMRRAADGRRRGRAGLAAAAGGLVLLMAAVVDAGTVYYHYDGLGRLVSMCDTASGKRIRYAYDANGNRTSWTVTTAACTANTPPTAVNDTVSGYFQYYETITVQPLNNDSDADGDDLYVMSASCLSNCSVYIDNNTLYITPISGDPQSISYTISDGHGGSATAYVTITGFAGGGGCGGFIC